MSSVMDASLMFSMDHLDGLAPTPCKRFSSLFLIMLLYICDSKESMLEPMRSVSPISATLLMTLMSCGWGAAGRLKVEVDKDMMKRTLKYLLHIVKGLERLVKDWN